VAISGNGEAANETRAASRQVAALFLLSGLLAVMGIPTAPDRAGVLWLIAGLDGLVALSAYWLPWSRWGPRSTALLAVPGFVILSVSTWAFGGFAAGVGPFFVLLFAWLGLHHPPRVAVLFSPVAAASYALGLFAADADPRLVGSTVVLVPIALAVGLVIAVRVRQLNQAREEIEQMDRWRAALMATLAHDVRSPMTTIRGTLEIALDDPALPDHLRPLLTSANRQSARITSLATNLLDLERVDAGKLRIDVTDVNLLELGSRVADLVGRPDIELHIDPALVVRADPMRLEQMLVNLSTNALRHGRPPIVLSADRYDDRVEIRVRDHGPGVPASDQPYLFERFSGSDTAPESVGLGLWIVRLLAEAHHGTVGYRTLAPGAEFGITIPQPMESRGPIPRSRTHHA
jgi:signal transduction histidine kinase